MLNHRSNTEEETSEGGLKLTEKGGEGWSHALFARGAKEEREAENEIQILLGHSRERKRKALGVCYDRTNRLPEFAKIKKMPRKRPETLIIVRGYRGG